MKNFVNAGFRPSATHRPSTKVKRLAFPQIAEEDPHKLILVRRTVTTAGPDRAAQQYLINRILGTPTAVIEASDGAGGPLFKAYLGVDPDRV